MSDEFTPTTEDVRRAYREHCRDYDAIDGLATSHESYEDEFNRWRDNDRAEAQVAALREAVRHVDSLDLGAAGMDEITDWIMRRANNIAREAGIETGDSNG